MSVNRLFGLLAMLCGLAASVAANGASEQRGENDDRAKELLARAVEYYREKGERALPAFSRQGEFIDGSYYIYVVNTDGIMLASGGPSSALIGSNILKSLPPEYTVKFKKALSSDEQDGIQESEYRWVNWKTGHSERKRVFYQRVGDAFVAAGFFVSRATSEQAHTMLQKAAAAVAERPKQTIDAINSSSVVFLEDDLYVFIVDLRSERFVAHGFNRRMVGRNFQKLIDPSGQPVGQPMLDMAAKHEQGQHSYQWVNPVSREIETKHSYFKVVGPYLVSVGYYDKPAR
ncbi:MULTISPECIES: cache domain-containing protein [Stutzerimonas]|jgi:cytochrome c|uniref:cache domain-containing protein n=1 Tax=Stutzerimonas TaxID=2901164 RepID=UPI0021AE0011|nr:MULTISPECIES: cache domain-containing protein [Stutzerimonas]